ncbi:acyl-CoA thioesterase II [Frankia sp. QA3]|uniref:acyl-CoA thioesterase n=1 Tax=Frankia sp. QA3 TaxID=710111 RepID=UPI000269BED4|nr:acyl-CoA thioesterase domain-containing protein [Frankia sp. QA3]EIV92381.1 acyl-CoA thioesterase [Frankia sp. QA3]
MSEHSVAQTLEQALQIVPVGEDDFQSVSLVDTGGYPLYGGQILALALRAAAMTIEADRRPHSLHGYFLRAGRLGAPVTLHVDRDRDGRSFSARRVVALQDGKAIFSMVTSFTRGTGDFVLDEVPRLRRTYTQPPDKHRMLLLDLYEFTPRHQQGDRFYFPDHAEILPVGPLSDDWLTQTCAAAYMSDIGTGFGQVADPAIASTESSVSHSIWFHAPARADDGLTLEMWPSSAASGLGLYSGSVRDAAGNLILAIAQEQLIRSRKPAPGAPA